jgi:heme/copper-type cytochrome/quinol oxidase subunit 2
MSLIAALVLGLVLINIIRSSFLTASGIQLELSAIYLESITYIAGIILVALTVFFFMLVIFRRRTLNANIRRNKKIFRKVSVVVQLIISIVFAFCTLVILKQMYYLHGTDLGFSFKNRGSVLVFFDQINVLNDKMQQIPEIKETVTGYFPLLWKYRTSSWSVSNWDDKHGDAEHVNINGTEISEEYAKFYEFELIEGEFLRNDDDEKYVLINETAAKAFGWHKSTGKSFDNIYVIKGVMKNIYNFSPTIAVKPFFYHKKNSSGDPFILFKYEEGSWKTCMEYLTLLAIGALIAFSIGYTVMKRWLEQYVIQIEISAWIYLSILLALIIIIVMCVGGRVYKTSRENSVNAINR